MCCPSVYQISRKSDNVFAFSHLDEKKKKHKKNKTKKTHSIFDGSNLGKP